MYQLPSQPPVPQVPPPQPAHSNTPPNPVLALYHQLTSQVVSASSMCKFVDVCMCTKITSKSILELIQLREQFFLFNEHFQLDTCLSVN